VEKDSFVLGNNRLIGESIYNKGERSPLISHLEKKGPKKYLTLQDCIMHSARCEVVRYLKPFWDTTGQTKNCTLCVWVARIETDETRYDDGGWFVARWTLNMVFLPWTPHRWSMTDDCTSIILTNNDSVTFETYFQITEKVETRKETYACIVQPQPPTRKSQPPYPHRLHRTYSSPCMARLPKITPGLEAMPPISASKASSAAMVLLLSGLLDIFGCCSRSGGMRKQDVDMSGGKK
jgi:hypothetical protein